MTRTLAMSSSMDLDCMVAHAGQQTTCHYNNGRVGIWYTFLPMHLAVATLEMPERAQHARHAVQEAQHGGWGTPCLVSRLSAVMCY